MRTSNQIKPIVADELLRQMEEYRCRPATYHVRADHAIRICEAIVARAAGYESRADWMQVQESA